MEFYGNIGSVQPNWGILLRIHLFFRKKLYLMVKYRIVRKFFRIR